MVFVKTVFCSVMLLVLTACAGTYRTYVEMIKLVVAEQPDVELTYEQVKQSKSDLLYVTNGERAQAAMALAFLEAGQHKWISADNAILVMEQGRIVRTLGLDNNLLHLTNLHSDPIRRINEISPDHEWLRLADWDNGEYGYRLRSRFEVIPEQQLAFFQQQLTTILVVEHLQYEDNANYLRFDGRWQNRFWFDSASGTLIKSEQTLAPFVQPITMTYISRIARLLPAVATTTAQVNHDEK